MQVSATSICIAISAGVCLAPAVAGQTYELVQIPNLPGWSSMLANDMNDAGHAVGIGFESFGLVTRAFYYDGQTTHDFSAPLIATVPPQFPFVGTRALDINNRDHILLNLEVVDLGVFPYVWDGRDFIEVAPDLPPGAGQPGAAAMNDHGVIVGTFATPHGDRAYLWDRMNDTTVVIAPPAPFTNIGASHISNSGWVTGSVSGGGQVSRGFVWKDGAITVMPAIDANDFLSMSQRVNDAGFAGGFTTTNPQPGMPNQSRIVFWSAQGVHDVIALLPGFTGVNVRGINNANEVVGTLFGPQQAFHWRGNELRRLNDYIISPIPGATLDLWEASAVNASGQILADGQYVNIGDFSNYAFILTPDVPPTVPGDITGDGSVNVNDLLAVINAWGTCPAPPEPCDADIAPMPDGDGQVNVTDLLMVISNWS